MMSKLKINNIENDIRFIIYSNMCTIVAKMIRNSNFNIVDKNINGSIWFKIYDDIRNVKYNIGHIVYDNIRSLINVK